MTLPMSHGPRSRFQWLRFGAVFASLFGSYQVVEDVRGFSAGMLATTKLYVVRHGAVIPPGGRTAAIYGGAEVELSETGKAEAQAAAEYLMSEVPLLDAVYSSGLKRAIYGAESICGGRGLQPIKDSRFNEINRGVWVGLTRDEIAERYPDHMRSIGSLSTFEGDPEFSGHGGESYRELGRRVLEGRDSLLLKHPGSTICVVCHNWVVAALVGDASGIPPEQWCTLKIPTASVSLLEILHHKAKEDDDDSMVIKDQKVVFSGKSPADYTGGRLAENVGSVFFSGKG